MSTEVEKTILKALTINNEFTVKVLPYIKKDYFQTSEHKYIYETIEKFVKKYNNLPTFSAINIGLERFDMEEKMFQTTKKILKEIFTEEQNVEDDKFIYDICLKFCKDRALHNALKEVIIIAEELKVNENEKSSISETKIPEILKEAIAIDFNTNIGQDYIEDAEARFERYGKLEEKIPFALSIFNDITNGGANKGFFHVFIGGTSVGKSLVMTSLVSDDLRQGFNVLYITLELDHDIIAKRIDANLMNIDINNVHLIGNNTYMNNINNIKKKTLGKIIIIEDFSGNFTDKKLIKILEELKLKKNFTPDKVYIDYLAKTKSSIYKEGGVNSNTYYGSVSEEFRNVGRKYNFATFTAMQFNRGGYDNSDANITDIADSWGVTNNSDWIGIILTSKELKELGQIEIKQGKTKYTDLSINERFYLGIDKNKMKIYELNNSYPYQNNSHCVENQSTTRQSSGRYDSLVFE